MQLSPLTLNDLGGVAALQPADWGDIVAPAREYILSPFCYPVKIVEHGTMIGMGTTIVHANSAWLAHIIVHPDHRSKGIGTIITQALIGSLKNTSCETILLIATELGAFVYSKLGFEKVNDYIFMTGGT